MVKVQMVRWAENFNKVFMEKTVKLSTCRKLKNYYKMIYR